MKKPKFEVGNEVIVTVNDIYIITVIIDDIIPGNSEWMYIIDDCSFPESHLTLIEE